MTAIPANNGWTCEHVSNQTGPCWKCAPASGLCQQCGEPLDDHSLASISVKCRKEAA